MESWEIEDPSDWPSQFVDLKKLDSLLRCSICFDYFDIAVIVPICSHNYCSLCIRKHVSHHKCCPSCNKNLDDNDLKPNRVLDELVNHFKAVRKKLLAFCKQEKGVAKEVEDEVFEDSIRYRNPQSRSHVSPDQPEPTCSRKIQSKGSREDNTNNKTLKTETLDTVGCPVCQCKVSSKTINTHLDVCLNGSLRPKRKLTHSQERDDQPKSKKFFPGYAKSQEMEKKVVTANDMISVNDGGRRKPLPKMCLDAMNEKQLKNKLKSFHLPIKGDRQTLKKRLKEFCLLYNSQCDSENPMSEQAVANEIIQREKEVSSMAYKPELIATHDHRLSIDQKVKINEEHSKRNNGQYKKLIEDVKNRKLNTPDHDDHEEILSSATKFTFSIDLVKSEEEEPEFEEFDEKPSVFPESPKRRKDIVKKERDIVKNESIIVEEDNDIPEDEFIFDTKIKKTSNPSKRKVNKVSQGKNKTKGKVQKKQSNSMIENYFARVGCTKSKHSASYSVGASNKTLKVDTDFAPQSDSNSDTDDVGETSHNIIPESPEMFRSPYFNSTSICGKKKKSLRTLNSTTIAKQSAERSLSSPIAVSPISNKPTMDNVKPSVKNKSPRKLLGSFSLGARQQAHVDQSDLSSVNSSLTNNLDDASFDNHLDTLVEEVYDREDDVDSDATLSDVDIIPNPPSEYDFTFTESQMF